MKINTKIFGEMEIDNERIIHFTNGIIGFPKLKKFALIHDEDSGYGAGIKWLQSLEEESFALPVMDPLLMVDSYNPRVDDELLKPIECVEQDDILVLVTVTVPKDITKISINLRAPIVINAQNCKATQIIVDDEEYDVKHYIYNKMQAAKAGE